MVGMNPDSESGFASRMSNPDKSGLLSYSQEIGAVEGVAPSSRPLA